MCRFDVIPIKIPSSVFIETEKVLLNCVGLFPALRRQEWEDQEFKVILDYLVNLRPAWDT